MILTASQYFAQYSTDNNCGLSDAMKLLSKKWNIATSTMYKWVTDDTLFVIEVDGEWQPFRKIIGRSDQNKAPE